MIAQKLCVVPLAPCRLSPHTIFQTYTVYMHRIVSYQINGTIFQTDPVYMHRIVSCKINGTKVYVWH